MGVLEDRGGRADEDDLVLEKLPGVKAVFPFPWDEDVVYRIGRVGVEPCYPSMSSAFLYPDP